MTAAYQINPGRIPVPAKRPIPGAVPFAAKRPVVRREPPSLRQCWQFSLQFWRQIENFGLGKADQGWFIGLLDRLKQLSNEKLVRFLEDTKFQDDLRYHKIDWNWRNIPIARGDINWIPQDVMNNPEEFELYQIQISQAEGRIVGYWSVDWHFNIVLLDPRHNIQPCDYSDYKVRPTTLGQSSYSSLRLAIERAAKHRCGDRECKLYNVISNEANQQADDHTVILACLPDETATRLRTLIKQGRAKDISEILEFAATFYEDAVQ